MADSAAENRIGSGEWEEGVSVSGVLKRKEDGVVCKDIRWEEDVRRWR